MIDKFTPYWQPLSSPIKIAVVALAVIAAAVFFSSVAGSIQRRNYEKKITQLSAATSDATKKADAFVAEAERLKADNAALTILLNEANQKLLDANAELVDAHNATSQTRKVYLEKKVPVSVPVYLTGDATADSRALCAKLASDGFPCR